MEQMKQDADVSNEGRQSVQDVLPETEPFLLLFFFLFCSVLF